MLMAIPVLLHVKSCTVPRITVFVLSFGNPDLPDSNIYGDIKMRFYAYLTLCGGHVSSSVRVCT